MATTDLVQHAFHGQSVRIVLDEHNEPWFVLADLLRVLDVARRPSAVSARLDQGDVRQACIPTAGGPQQVLIVNEGGMWETIIRSDAPGATAVRRWVTTEVLPSIRRTGSYGAPALTGPTLVAAALIEAHAMLEQKDATIAALEPRAQVADELLDASGDVSVADAAKALSRAGIAIGATRLFAVLDGLGWIYRGSDARWHVKQSAIERGRMAVLPQSHAHPRTGERVVDTPQPRVTPKGIAYLLQHLSEPRRLAVVS